jgi:hypothetical protein
LVSLLRYHERFAGFGCWAAIEKSTGEFLDGPTSDRRGRRVWAETMAITSASRRVMEKAGLTLERTVHQEWHDPIEGAERGEVEYALRMAEWERRVRRNASGVRATKGRSSRIDGAFSARVASAMPTDMPVPAKRG